MIGNKMVGHNIINFDLPYLNQSTAMHCAKGHKILQPDQKGYWNNVFFDTMKWWQAGNRQNLISLDRLSKAFGHKGKNGSGKHFHALSRAEQEDYLENDLRATAAVFNGINQAESICENWTVFDIETAPRSIEYIQSVIPEFDPTTVKTGNLKDPDKILQKIDAARENHLDSVLDKAGLHADYSVPVAIGYLDSTGNMKLDFGSPKDLVTSFWEIAGEVWLSDYEQTKLKNNS